MENILVIDPTGTFKQSMETVIIRLGYGFLSAGSPRAALELLRNHCPALIITDSHLPVMEGSVLCSRIRQIPGYSDIPMILVAETGDDHGCGRYEGLFSECLLKPLSTRTIFETLQKHLPHAQKRRKLRAAIRTQVMMGSGGTLQQYETLSLGEGGMLLKTRDPLSVGTEVDILLGLPGVEPPVKARGKVIYLISEPGQGQLPALGIKFLSMSPEAESVLAWFIESYVTDSLPESARFALAV